MSNFAPSRQVIHGTEYNCVEQFYQAMRADMTDKRAIKEEIMSLPASGTSNTSQKRMLMLGRSCLDNDKEAQAEWDQICLRVMIRGLTAKFTQYPELRARLLVTGKRPIGEATHNPRWGIGLHWSNPEAANVDEWRKNGNNLLRLCLSFVRAS